MAFQELKTDRRLWFRISLVLFVIPFFLPIVNIGVRGGPGAPVFLLADVINDSSMDEFLSFIGIYALLFGVPAIGIGWVIQRMIVRGMGFTKFNTDRRLWFWISLVLFVIPWFLPIIWVKGESLRPAHYWIGLFTDSSHMEELVGIGYFTSLFGVTAFAVGWVFQCVIVMVKSRRENMMNAKTR